MTGHSGRGDEQRARGGSAQHRHRVRGRAEGRLGHADHRDAELGVGVRAQARAPGRVEIDVTVDHEQAQPADAAQHGAQRRQLPQVELARPVRHDLGNDRDLLGEHHRERRVGGQHRRGAGPA
jgi:hypothetical protein